MPKKRLISGTFAFYRCDRWMTVPLCPPNSPAIMLRTVRCMPPTDSRLPCPAIENIAVIRPAYLWNHVKGHCRSQLAPSTVDGSIADKSSAVRSFLSRAICARCFGVGGLGPVLRKDHASEPTIARTDTTAPKIRSPTTYSSAALVSAPEFRPGLRFRGVPTARAVPGETPSSGKALQNSAIGPRVNPVSFKVTFPCRALKQEILDPVRLCSL